jgi:hypothetical protein
VSERQRPAQAAPSRIDASFPGVARGRDLHFRAHAWRQGQPEGGCWFYASLPAPNGAGGRFDIPAPGGTCYWADTELAAARERLGRPGDMIAADEVEGAVVTAAVFDPGHLADLLAVDAARHGVTAELSSSTPYRVCQSWAAAFAAAGFNGVRYGARFSSDPATVTAVFGGAGAMKFPPPSRFRRSMAAVLRDNGYTVLTTPNSSELGDLLE